MTLVRHPEPLGGAGRCYGRTDLDVDPAVLDATATRLGADLLTRGGAAPGRVVTSPLRRARLLGERLAAELERPLVTDDRLTEIDFGRWEGLLWDDVPREELDAWAADLTGYRGHGGESVDDLAARVAGAMVDWRPGDVVVTHLGVVRAALAATGDPDPWDVALPFGGTLAIGTMEAERE